jgi:hypothetical protein
VKTAIAVAAVAMGSPIERALPRGRVGCIALTLALVHTSKPPDWQHFRAVISILPSDRTTADPPDSADGTSLHGGSRYRRMASSVSTASTWRGAWLLWLRLRLRIRRRGLLRVPWRPGKAAGDAWPQCSARILRRDLRYRIQVPPATRKRPDVARAGRATPSVSAGHSRLGLPTRTPIWRGSTEPAPCLVR